MRKAKSISKQSLQILMGVIVGLFLLSQPAITSEHVIQQDEKEQSGSDGQSSSSEQQSISEAVTSSGPQINLGFQSILLQEVVLEEDIEDQSTLLERLLPTTQKAFKILFRRIISPNAP